MSIDSFVARQKACDAQIDSSGEHVGQSTCQEYCSPFAFKPFDLTRDIHLQSRTRRQGYVSGRVRSGHSSDGQLCQGAHSILRLSLSMQTIRSFALMLQSAADPSPATDPLVNALTESMRVLFEALKGP